MKVPKTLRVCGHDITVVTKKGELKAPDGRLVWAIYNDKTHTLYLSAGMDKTRQMEVILHEAIHAISCIHVLGLTENQTKLLGVELLALIRNNKLDLLSTDASKRRSKT